MTCHDGSIFFSSKLLLRNVLYVPNLTCHLIPIPQLLQQNPSHYVCIVVNTCVVQDRATRTEIRAVRLTNGVFHFSQAQILHVSISSFDLFHRLLGHSSYSVMNKIKGVSFILVLV